MHQVLKLNGSAHKDLTRIARAISKIRHENPFKPVSVVISDDENVKDGQGRTIPNFNHVATNGTIGDDAQEIHSLSALANRRQKPVVDVFVAGTGSVGSEFVRQLLRLEDERFDFRIIGHCNSRFATFNNRGTNTVESTVLDTESHTGKTEWNEIAARLISEKGNNLVLVDATGSEEPVGFYRDLLKAGIHIVTPGKLANVREQAFFDEITGYEKNGVFYSWEATAGAGLPVVQTIQNLKNCGDQITRIQGVLSGTMTYIFGELDRGIPFSQAVKKAAELGYSEPDPRDDLSGEDVARKFLILARAAGYKVERNNIRLENQIPEELVKVSAGAFLDRLPDYDEYWEKRVSESAQKGETLRFVGEMNQGNINISVRSVPLNSPAGRLTGTDNLVSIYTKYYDRSPLVIQGPGAGREVTAQAVLNDVRQIALKTAVVNKD